MWKNILLASMLAMPIATAQAKINVDQSGASCDTAHARQIMESDKFKTGKTVVLHAEGADAQAFLDRVAAFYKMENPLTGNYVTVYEKEGADTDLLAGFDDVRSTCIWAPFTKSELAEFRDPKDGTKE